MAADDSVVSQAGLGHQPGVQPGLGADAHRTKTSSWITVGFVVLGFIILGIALPLTSVPLAIIGGVILLVGVVTGLTGKIMDDVH